MYFVIFVQKMRFFAFLYFGLIYLDFIFILNKNRLWSSYGRSFNNICFIIGSVLVVILVKSKMFENANFCEKRNFYLFLHENRILYFTRFIGLLEWKRVQSYLVYPTKLI